MAEFSLSSFRKERDPEWEAALETLDTPERSGKPMTFRQFSAANRNRCESHLGFAHKLNSWSTSDWITATVGELGEAANVAKKLNRIRDGIPGNSESYAELNAAIRDEIADTFIYLDLLAQSLGFLLEDAVREKFDRTSEKIGSEIRCPGSTGEHGRN